MRKTVRIWGILSLVVCVSGCPDGPPQILHDEINAASEVADYLSRVTDEDSARIALAVAERLKSRWEDIKKRRENYIKLAEGTEKLQFAIWQDPDAVKAKLPADTPAQVKEVVANASRNYGKEMKASFDRLESDAQRVRFLTNIADGTVFGNIQQFAGKVFGSKLELPKLPIETTDAKKFEGIVKRSKDELSASMGGNASQIVIYVALGFVVVGTALTFVFRK
jgi:hypothetical protein